MGETFAITKKVTTNIRNSVVPENDTIVLVPLVLENTTYVNAMIACNVGDSVTFTIVAGEDYANYGFHNIADSMSAQTLALTMMALDQNVFGHSDFEILDTRLFNYPNLDTVERFCRIAPHQAPSTNVMELISYMYCYEVWVADNQGQLVGCAPGQPCNTGHNEVQCTTAFVWANFITSEGGGGSGTGEGGSGGGSGGTGGGTTPGWTYVTEEYQSPCDPYIYTLQNNTAFTTAFRYLNNPTVTSLSYEQGYLVNNLATGAYTGKSGAGTYTKEIEFDISAPLNGIIHSHFARGNSIFSPDDIVFLARIFLSNNLARDSVNLFMGVTSLNNPPYLIKVTNVAKFRIFANKIAETDTKQNAFIDNNAKKFNFNNAAANEVGFLNMLKDNLGALGLTLYRGNDDCNRWTKLTVDNFNLVSETPCNL